MKEQLKSGFVYCVEHLRGGEVLSREEVHNLMPTEALNHLVSTEYAGGAQVGTWYVGIYEGNFTPDGDETAATLPGAATECTAYDAATRIAFVPGTVAGGAVDNAASRAEFEMNDTKTVYGGFLSSAAAKGATTGVLGSVVRYASPKPMTPGDVLRVTAGFSIVSSS